MGRGFTVEVSRGWLLGLPFPGIAASESCGFPSPGPAISRPLAQSCGRPSAPQSRDLNAEEKPAPYSSSAPAPSVTSTLGQRMPGASPGPGVSANRVGQAADTVGLEALSVQCENPVYSAAVSTGSCGVHVACSLVLATDPASTSPCAIGTPRSI